MNRSHLILAAATLAFGTAAAACSDDEDPPVNPTSPTTTTGMTTNSGGGGTGGATSAGGMGGSGGNETCSIVAIANDAGLTSLTAAATQAGLADTIEGLENATIFAPTNAAFTALLTQLDVELSELTPEQLTPVLTYHIADSVIDSDAAIAAAAAGGPGEFPTLGGTVAIEGDASVGLTLDPDEAGAAINLEMVNIETCNGTIVHVIDAVIVPSITDIVVSQPDYQELEDLIGTATQSAAIVSTLDDPAGTLTLFAPTNEAVMGITAPADPSNDLLFHVLPAVVPAEDALTLTDSPQTTAEGANMTVDGNAGAGPVTIAEGANGAATVTITNIPASNGVIHRIDDVLLAP